MKRRVLIILGLLVLAALLAIAMRETIKQTIIQPFLYVWWVLGVYYAAFPQTVTWIILVVVVVMIEFGGLFAEDPDIVKKRTARKPVQGPVELLASWFIRAPGGLYFKWLIAQRLGKLSRELLAFNARQAVSSAHATLDGPDWNPSVGVSAYLESGLNGSFADYPRPRWPFRRPAPTPLDLDPGEAVDYIESKMDRT